MRGLITKENSIRWEDILFYSLIFLLLFPVFSLLYLFTHDGPAHVYNACLIKEYVAGNPLVNEFLHLKEFPEPNWTGHLLISIFSIVFPPNVAEKILLGMYIILFPYFFRKVIQLVQASRNGIVLLVIPFIYSYFFFGGLYNFLTGLTIFFASLYFIFPLMNANGNKKYVLIFLFSILLYLSHLVPFGVFIVLISFAHLFSFQIDKKKDGNSRFVSFLKSSIPMMIALLPSILLTAVFLFDKISLPAVDSSFSFPEMMETLFFIKPIITFQYSPENIFSMILFSFILVLLILGLSKMYFKPSQKKDASELFYKRTAFWATASLSILALFLCIPDQAASGGVIKFRFALFFFLFVIILLQTIPAWKMTNIFVSLFVTVWIFFKFIYLYPIMKNLNYETVRAMRCTEHIREKSILLPLNYSGNWMHCNLFNYAGTVKEIFVLDNYEAGMLHFPLEWRAGKNPVTIMGNFNIEPPPLCADMGDFEKQTGHNIDYVVVWDYTPLTDSCTINIRRQIDSGYHLIYKDGETLMLYERN